jgi:glycosyltransferase involved in cell wall biosynthesis
MAKTKVLFLISSLAQGGAERHLIDLVRRLQSRDFQADICVLKNRVHFEGEVPAGQPRYVLNANTWVSPLAFRRLVSVIQEARPDIVHAYLNDGNLWARLATAFVRGTRPRVITSVHLDDMPAVYRCLERRLASRSDRIVAHSRSIERLLVDRLGVHRARVQTITNGIATERFHVANVEERRRARAHYELDDNAFVALMPARIAPQKNQDLVVAALARLKAAHALPANVRLLFAGRSAYPRFDRRLRASIGAADLGAHVRFLGAVRDVQQLYAAADAVLMPSRTEASPIAAMEAMACGIPVLLSAAANTDAVLLDGRHGWEISNTTADSIAAVLPRIFALAPKTRSEMGAAARAHILAGFGFDRVASDFVHLYEALLAPSPPLHAESS